MDFKGTSLEAEIISCEEFAKRVGTSSRTIRRKIDSGKLNGDALQKMDGRKIPYLVFHIAKKQYEATADKATRDGKKIANSVKKESTVSNQAKVEVLPSSDVIEEAKKQVQEDVYDRLAKAKMESEEHKARLAKLKIEKEEGKLVDAEVAKQTVIKLVTETREALLNIPDNLGPELLACKDLLDLQNKLMEGINEALLNLSRFSFVGEDND